VLFGFHLAAWWGCPTASGIALCGGVQFALAWFATALPGWWRRLGAGSVFPGVANPGR
jgi:hypothetical protein